MAQQSILWIAAQAKLLSEELSSLIGQAGDKLDRGYKALTLPPSRNPYSTEYEPVYPYSQQSKNKLATCHPNLIFLANKLADLGDYSIIHGYREEYTQNQLYLRKVGLPWPTSLHNQQPSMAVDIVPYPVDWNDTARFDIMIGAAYAIAKEEGINMRSGKWFSNLADYSHLELT